MQARALAETVPRFASLIRCSTCGGQMALVSGRRRGGQLLRTPPHYRHVNGDCTGESDDHFALKVLVAEEAAARGFDLALEVAGPTRPAIHPPTELWRADVVVADAYRRVVVEIQLSREPVRRMRQRTRSRTDDLRVADVLWVVPRPRWEDLRSERLKVVGIERSKDGWMSHGVLDRPNGLGKQVDLPLGEYVRRFASLAGTTDPLLGLDDGVAW